MSWINVLISFDCDENMAMTLRPLSSASANSRSRSAEDSSFHVDLSIRSLAISCINTWDDLVHSAPSAGLIWICP